jgi:hypothetical protein
MEHRIQEGLTYRHFKGGIYKIMTMAADCDDPTKIYVVYRNIEDEKTWAREYNDFASKVDKDKYPDVTQEYRFELIPSNY